MASKYMNPIVSGFYPDPSAIRVGGDYYMVTSSFEYFPGVPILHSKDLVHWRKIGYCLTRKSQLDLTWCLPSKGIWASTIRYHEGLFYMITTVMNYGKLRKFFVTAKDIAGEWSDPLWIDHEGPDPDIFFDDDGKVYVSSAVGGNGGINQVQVDPKTGKVLSEDRVIWKGTGGAVPEGPHIYKINGLYYLTIAEGGTQYGHMQTIARSKSPWGPFEVFGGNPILTHRDRGGFYPVQGVGHGDFLQDVSGEWWAVFHAFRLSRQYFHHLGRETFLAPIVWDAQGWPVVGNNGTVELEMEADLPSQHSWPKLPVRDDFDAKSLSLEWNYVRNPELERYSLSARPGSIALYGSSRSINDIASSTVICRRQEHFNCKSAALVDFEPKEEGEEAGLMVLYQNEYHCEIGIIRENGRRKVVVRRRTGDMKAVVARLDAPEGLIELVMLADKLKYQIGFVRGGTFIEMATAGTQYVSCEAAPAGFTGVFFGLYATGNGKECTTAAYFDWFDYEAAGN